MYESKATNTIKYGVLLLALICVFQLPIKAKALVFSEVNIDIQYCECPAELAGMVGNKTYVYFAYYYSNVYKEWLAVYDLVPYGLEIWWNGNGYDSLKIHCITGYGTEYDTYKIYTRSSGGEWVENSGGLDSVSFWYFQDNPTALLKYNNIEILRVLTKEYTSETTRPTPIPTPTNTPTPTPIPVVNLDADESGLSELFHFAMEIMNIPISINGYEVTFLQIFIYIALASMTLILIFSASKD